MACCELELTEDAGRVTPARIEVASATGAGSWHGPARDRVAVAAEAGTFVLCRGHGGAGAGLAAELAVERLRSGVAASVARAGGPREADLAKAFAAADRDVWLRARPERLRGMGASAVALAIGQRGAAFGWVGNSRLYLWRPDVTLACLTFDNRPAELGGTVRRTEAPRSALLGRAVASPGLGVVPLLPGDVFVLCSSGLANGLTHAELEAVLVASDGDLTAGAAALIDESELGGRMSEASVVLVRASHGG